ncbi:hypothetical protein [Streptomyces sp. NPDC048349]|uniref:hypothetical protein n=1 Tax=Streptomyces sp. NPDC048349 TaxID=3155486 RepID=UPI00344990FD
MRNVDRTVDRNVDPFELPRSMQAVETSRADVPDDTADPVFAQGHGLSLEAGTSCLQPG